LEAGDGCSETEQAIHLAGVAAARAGQVIDVWRRRRPVNLFAKLFDDGVERNLVVGRVGFQPGIEAVADRGHGAALSAVPDDRSIGPVRQKVLQRDSELVNERHGDPLPLPDFYY
jgi:hypothetical protein